MRIFIVSLTATGLAMAQGSASQKHGIWEDPATRKMWAAADNGFGVSWRQADYYCSTLTVNGYRDWKLPSIEDLQQLVGPSANASGYRIIGPIKLTGWEWSSSPGVERGEAWALDFGDGGRASVVWGDSGLNRALCTRSLARTVD